MTASERRKLIIGHLMVAGGASVEELAARFQVSRMTVHRDLDQLESEGLLRKVHGGASMLSDSQFESSYQYRKHHDIEEKRAIARAASQHIRPGQSVLIDGGSTVGAMVEFLLEKQPLTVVTYHAEVMTQLMGENGITLIALGGLYDRHSHMFYGLQTEQAARSLRVDVAFMSTSSVCGASAFHQSQEIVKIKRAAIDIADRCYLLLEHRKFDRSALFHMATLDAFDAVITSREPSPSACSALRDAGVPLEIVDTNHPSTPP